jgi:hypothetical protein
LWNILQKRFREEQHIPISADSKLMPNISQILSFDLKNAMKSRSNEPALFCWLGIDWAIGKKLTCLADVLVHIGSSTIPDVRWPPFASLADPEIVGQFAQAFCKIVSSPKISKLLCFPLPWLVKVLEAGLSLESVQRERKVHT